MHLQGLFKHSLLGPAPTRRVLVWQVWASAWESFFPTSCELPSDADAWQRQGPSSTRDESGRRGQIPAWSNRVIQSSQTR